MLLAFILCFSTLPMTAFAQEADVVTEQEEQQEADSAERQEKQQEADSAEGQEEQQEADSAEGQEEQQEAVPVTEQKEVEAAAAPGEETPADKSTTVEAPGTEDSIAGEVPDTVAPTVESVSDSDAGTQDTGADDEKKAAVQKVQALIDALPETVTVENAESVSEQLEAIAEAMDALTEEQIAELDMEHLYAISEAMSAPMTVEEGEHTHFLCGKDTCNGVDGHTETNKVTFQAWNGTSELPKKVGNYYLTNNVTLREAWTPVDGVVLCLNGYTITVEAKVSGIIVENRETFTLCDCANSGKITHGLDSNGEKYDGRGVDVSNGTFNMYGGSITDNKAFDGVGVGMKSGTFNMYGGKITENKTGTSKSTNQKGTDGGVSVGERSIFNMYAGIISGNEGANGGGVGISGGTFNMSGGIIENNGATGDDYHRDSGYGGGVCIYATENSVFNMSGGIIRNNRANCGGGVFVGGTQSFNMTGGEITGNTADKSGSGVYLIKNSHFTVSGSAKVSGNTTSNVYLPDGATMAIGKGGFDNTANIGVTTEKLPTQGSYVAIATGAANGGYRDGAFINDQKTDDCKFQQVGDQILLVNGTLHQHPICGNTCDHDSEHANVAWKGVSSLSEIKTGGYYYLTKDIDRTQTWNLPNHKVVLCLNGYNITANANVDVIKTSSYEQFILTDCMGERMEYGKITHKEGNVGRGIYVNSSFTMYGGEISGNTIDASASVYGGGVYVDYGSFTMHGGSITNNKISETIGNGGGVFVSDHGSFTMDGGSIIGNRAPGSGGGVYSMVDFIVSGKAIITNNTAMNGQTANNARSYKTIKVDADGLDRTAQIGVTTSEIAEGSYAVVAEGTDSYRLSDTDLSRFSSDAGYTRKLVDNRIVFINGTPHEHPICGKTDCNDDHSNVLWNLLTYDAGTKQLKYGATTAKREQITNSTGHYVYTLPAGNYYLAQNITLDGSISISGDVNICLNGYEISTNQYNRVFAITNYKLAVCDCSTSHSGKIRGNHNRIGDMLVVYLQSNASFDLYGGTICGGDYGVYENMASSVTLFGGSITDNTYGVDGSDNPPIKIGGDAKVINNTKRNLFLRSNQVISINNSLTQDAQIGISTVTEPSANNNIQIATSATNDKLDYSKIFTSDATDQNYVVTKDAKGRLYLGIHQHNWKATAEGARITFKCSADGCKLESDFATTYTVTAPTDLIYSGSEKVATVTTDDKYSDGLDLPAPAITYQKLKETEYVGIEGAPKDVGTYRASITIDNVTASVTYNIVSKEVPNPTITVAGTYTYDGTKKKPSVVVKDGETEIPDSEYSVSYADNINAGTATVKITDVAGGNYDVSGSTTFTINKGAYNGTVEKKVTIIKKRSTAQTGTLTAEDFFPEGAVLEGAVIFDVNGVFDGAVVNRLTFDQDAGKISYITAANITSTTDQTCKVIISSTNYENIEATLTFHPTDKMTVTIDGLTYTGKTYDGKAMEPDGTLQVSGDKVPVSELEVTYAGTGNTTYNSSDAPKDAGTYKVTYKVADSNENYTGEVTYYFTISPKAVTADMIGAIADETYTGNDITPQPVVTDGNTILTSGADFDFIYDKNINAGKDTATLTITGKGNYTGIASQTFTINPKDIKGAAITLQADSLGYTGLMQEVQITSVTLDGVTLTTGDYYIVNDSNKQINADDSITLTIAGKGNYTGTATTTWKITKATPKLGNFDVTPDLSQKQTYDGKPKEVTAKTKNGVIDMGDVTVYYEGTSGTTYPRSKTAPTNAGTYQVILTVAEGKNYTTAEIEAGTLTIDKADLTVEDVTEFFEYTKTGAQTINIANLVPGARSYALGTAAGDLGVLSEAISIDATTGLMKFTLSALTIGNIDNKVTVPVTITSENYEDVTVNVIIYISPEYRIIDGANSSWTQNTDGTVVIRGNGEISKFHAVKVDGKVIDPANYDATEGSTIITLKAEYLKTLATGSHTFAIVWNNGIAGTNFTVAANTSGNNSGNNSNNNDSNHGSDNSGNNDSGNTAGAAANTAVASAQELDKVPATGDPFGIWLTLFAISLTGLAGMLARRKKN